VRRAAKAWVASENAVFERILWRALRPITEQVANVTTDALVRVFAVTRMRVGQLRDTDAAQAIPADLAIEVETRRITVPTGLVGAQPFALTIGTTLLAVEANTELVINAASLPRPELAATYADVTSGERVRSFAVSIQVAQRAQAICHSWCCFTEALARRRRGATCAMRSVACLAFAKGLSASRVREAQRCC